MMKMSEKEYNEIIEEAARLARDYELTYFGCSQTTLAGLIEAFGIGGSELLRSSTCLAGGVARRGNVCGALTGGLMMIGLLAGRDDLQMFDQYQRAMEYGNRLYERFEQEVGGVKCEEIHQLKFGRTFDLQSPEEREELHKRMGEVEEGCQSVTSAAARLTAELIVEILKEDLPLARMVARAR
jgi:C_GCAxxG_C_C family probable redox protein